jgi:N-acetyl-gamma-glutamyl-phosphate/LysW-gamma-L-alpha-aminoadipyl-6-phosphate reductase
MRFFTSFRMTKDIMKKITISIIGGSGYAGGELLRILLNHPLVHIQQVTSRQFAGQPVSTVHPNLRKVTDLLFVRPDALTACDVLIIGLPNGISMGNMQEYIKLAPKIIDLGADFRIHSQVTFEQWYHKHHAAPTLLPQFSYGIAELHREEIKKASYISCGGCEATVSILALYPLHKNNLIGSQVIIDAKMSSSQAGMTPSMSSHHPERAGVVRSYMPTGHRHTAEIEQELSGITAAISATAIDMVRGLLVTIHTVPAEGITEKDIWKAYRSVYGQEPFIRIVKESTGVFRYPEPKILQGTNFCDIGFELDKHTNRLVIIAAIDNLVKGTAGQAVQALNLMCGFEETTGLMFPGLHPI